MPEWAVMFLPQWEQAVKCILVGATVTQLWKIHRQKIAGAKPPDYVIALVSIALTFTVAVPVIWASSHNLAETFANAMIIGGLAPLLWRVFIAAARRYVPWLAAVLKEERRGWSRDDSGKWTQQQRWKELFEDTDEIDAEEIERWREESTERRHDE
jgi:hypothetical protein